MRKATGPFISLNNKSFYCYSTRSTQAPDKFSQRLALHGFEFWCCTKIEKRTKQKIKKSYFTPSITCLIISDKCLIVVYWGPQHTLLKDHYIRLGRARQVASLRQKARFLECGTYNGGTSKLGHKQPLAMDVLKKGGSFFIWNNPRSRNVFSFFARNRS